MFDVGEGGLTLNWEVSVNTAEGSLCDYWDGFAARSSVETLCRLLE